MKKQLPLLSKDVIESPTEHFRFASQLVGNAVRDGKHLASDWLKADLAGQKSRRHSLDDAPFPDSGGVKTGLGRRPQGSLVRIAHKEVEGVLAHEDSHVVLGLREQTVGSTSLNPPVASSVFH